MTDSAPTNNNNEPLAARMRRRAEAVPLQRDKEARERYERVRKDMCDALVDRLESMTEKGETSFQDIVPDGVVKRFASFVDLFCIPDDETIRALYDDLKAFAQLPENQFKWVERKSHWYGCRCDNKEVEEPCTTFVTIGV